MHNGNCGPAGAVAAYLGVLALVLEAGGCQSRRVIFDVAGAERELLEWAKEWE